MTGAEVAGKKSKASNLGRSTVTSADRPADKLETWIVRNSAWLALVIIVAAFAVRLYYCGATYLNPDEAQHFNAARPNSWLAAYYESTRLAHPPLFILVLHAFLFLGRSEVILRLPSLLAGTAALWVTFAWLRRSLGAVAALVGLLFIAVSPAAISASTEVRQYGLLLFFICSALYATERAFAEYSSRWAILQGFCLLCALLTHYTAPVAIASLDLYVVLRCIFDRASRRLLLLFAAAQVVLALVLIWLYFQNLSRSSLSHVAGFSYLNLYFARPGETALGFSKRALVATFAYMLNQKRAYLAMLLFVAGVVALLIGRTKASRLMGILIAAPFVVGLVTGIIHALPFAGSRHQTYLLPFLAAGFAAAFTWIPRKFAALSLLPVLAIALYFVARNPPDNNPRLMPVRDMTAAINFINQAIPHSAPLFVDEQTRFVLGYYLGRNDSRLDSPRGLWNSPTVGGRRLISSRDWLFDPDNAIAQSNKSAAAIGLPLGNPLWIVSVAWLDTPLSERIPAAVPVTSKEFGTISVIESAHQ
jgi:Dolichyl-phosphate-mannose-protein mannosyltransferase